MKKVIIKNQNKEAKDYIQEVLKKFKRTFIEIGIFSFFVNILVLAAPLYMLAVYDVVMPSKSIDTLIFVTAIIIIFFVGMGFLEFVRNKILIILSSRLDSMINEKIYNA